MKRFLFLVCATLMLCSACRTSRSTGKDTSLTVIESHDTTVVERLVPVLTPEDSARIRALLRCDENGRVLLAWYDQQCSRNAQLEFSLDSLGRLKANFKVPADTIYVPVKDTTINNSTNTDVKEKETITVPAELNGWQRFFITCGVVLCVMVILVVGYAGYRLAMRIRRKVL